MANLSRFITTILLSLTAFFFMTGFALHRTVDSDPSLPAMTLGGYRFHLETFGNSNNPVVIVLHGGPGADYRYLLGLQALADQFFVVFYDQRGTGLSPRVPASEISPQVFVDDLDLIVNRFAQGRPVHLLGHSWGAMLASAYTGAHPDKVDKLVLAEPGFLDSSTLDALASDGWPEWRVIWGVTKAWISKWLVQSQGDDYAREDYFLTQVMPLMQGRNQLCNGQLPLLEAWRFGSPNFEATVGRMQADPAFTASLTFRQGVDAFQGETLFLIGQCNQVMGSSQQRKHMVHFRHATLIEVPDAGHYMFNDQPIKSLATVRAFFNSTAR